MDRPTDASDAQPRSQQPAPERASALGKTVARIIQFLAYDGPGERSCRNCGEPVSSAAEVCRQCRRDIMNGEPGL